MDTQQIHYTVLQAFRDGLITQFKPQMLLAILLPFIISLIAIVLLISFAFDPLQPAVTHYLDHFSWTRSYLGSQSDCFLCSTLLSTILFIFLVAVGVAVGFAVAAVMVTPMAMRLISKQNFPHLNREGKYANSVSIANAIKVSLVFVFGWLITLPLWFIPLAHFILPIFWGAYLFSHMTRVDALVEHATAQERKRLLRERNSGFWIIGLICACLALIPFIGFIMPVFSIIVCIHYGMGSLQELRAHHPKTLTDPSIEGKYPTLPED